MTQNQVEDVPARAKARFLGTCSVFRRLETDELNLLADLAETVVVPAGTVLAQRATRSRYIYIVEDGLLRVDEADLSIPVELATAGRGDAVGCSSLVEPFLYSANVTALGDSRVIRIHAGDLLDFLRRRPQVGYDVMTAVAQQVRGRLDTLVAFLANQPEPPSAPQA